METGVPVEVVVEEKPAPAPAPVAGHKEAVSHVLVKGQHSVNATTPALILRLANPAYKCPDSFYQYFLENRFTDLTFSCIDGFIGCHKVVMAASSTYFDQFLRQNASTMVNNMAVAVNHTKLIELRYLLEFIYTGEIKIAYPMLDPVLAVGTQLQINSIMEFQYYIEESYCNVFPGLTLKTSPLVQEDETKKNPIPPVFTTAIKPESYYNSPTNPFQKPENVGKSLLLLRPWENSSESKVQPTKGKSSAFNPPGPTTKASTGPISSKRTKKQKPEACDVKSEVVGETNTSTPETLAKINTGSTGSSCKRTKKSKAEAFNVEQGIVGESNTTNIPASVAKTDNDTPKIPKSTKKSKKQKPETASVKTEIVPIAPKRMRRRKKEIEMDKKLVVNQKDMNVNLFPLAVERIINQVAKNIPRPFQELDPAYSGTSQSFNESDNGIAGPTSYKLEIADLRLASDMDTTTETHEVQVPLSANSKMNALGEFTSTTSDLTSTLSPIIKTSELKSPQGAGNINIGNLLVDVNKENGRTNTNDAS